MRSMGLMGGSVGKEMHGRVAGEDYARILYVSMDSTRKRYVRRLGWEREVVSNNAGQGGGAEGNWLRVREGIKGKESVGLEKGGKVDRK